MRRVSQKRAKRNAEAKPFRDGLIERLGHCELCGHDPTRVRFGMIAWRLDVHEISRGRNRDKALDKPYACLCVCFLCHGKLDSAAEYPEARQLAALRKSRPGDFDLVAYNAMIGRGPNRITIEEVNQYD